MGVSLGGFGEIYGVQDVEHMSVFVHSTISSLQPQDSELGSPQGWGRGDVVYV